jgi:outer membrane protein TolC
MMARALLCCFFLLLTATSWAAPLTSDDILKSSALHYPKILAALQDVEKKKAERQAATGAFDLRMDSDIKTRPSGYYDGQSIDTRLVKPVPGLNAEIYSGYRVSDGTFPIYEDELITQDSGEARIGVIFSLLRDRAIDKRRFGVLKADFGYELAVLGRLLTQLDVQLKAQKAYGAWVAAGEMRYVYRDLLQNAQKRQNILEAKVARGAVAKIILTENKQNILKRRAMLNEAERDLQQASFFLSLFLRDANGQTVIPDYKRLPDQLAIPFSYKKAELDNVAQNVISRRPELQSIIIEKEQQRAELRMGENMLLPKVDLGMEMSQDYGNGPRSLDQTTGILGIKLSIPLQRELGNGMVNTAQAALNKLDHEQKLIEDTLRVELKNIITDLFLYKQNMDISHDEVSLAQKMEQAERDLLDHGASNLFVLNSREEKSAEARIKNIALKLKLFYTLAAFHAATIQLDKLGLENARL